MDLVFGFCDFVHDGEIWSKVVIIGEFGEWKGLGGLRLLPDHFLEILPQPLILTINKTTFLPSSE